MKYKFREGDKVIIVNPLSGLPDDEGQEYILKDFIAATGTIIAVDKYGDGGAFPYEIKFDDKHLDRISNSSGGFLWEEHQLERYSEVADPLITRREIEHLLKILKENKGDIKKTEQIMARLLHDYKCLRGTITFAETVLNRLIRKGMVG